MSNSEEREDFLNEDAEIAGQKFCLLSFLSPEKVLAKKDLFFFGRFLDQYEYSVRVRNLETFLASTLKSINTKMDERAVEFDKQDLSGCADLCRSSRLRIDTVMNDLANFTKEHEKDMRESALKDAYEDYVFANKAKLEDDFFAKNEFRTSVRGMKVRGVYGSRSEAEARSKKLQRNDPLHNIFLGEVGKWLPWDPEPAEVTEQEYAEEQLNTLMKKYKENEEAREMFMRENRNRMRGSGPANITTSRPSEEEAASEFGGMFNGAADLAIERKMEKQ